VTRTQSTKIYLKEQTIKESCHWFVMIYKTLLLVCRMLCRDQISVLVGFTLYGSSITVRYCLLLFFWIYLFVTFDIYYRSLVLRAFRLSIFFLITFSGNSFREI